MTVAGARVMLLDTYGLVYRAFFALPALSTTHGMPINAAYGFTQMLVKLIGDERPTHVIACFDKGPPVARIEKFPAYKAHREAMPDDLRSQFALVRKILAVYRIPAMEMDGEEADDVIATLARKIETAGARAEVVTGDLDLLQIVDDATTVLVTRRGITDLGRYDPAAVRERFDLEPAQLPDYRGLKGDPSDNLPGIPGVGEKTAIKLIKSAGSLDALLADPALAGSAKLETLVREHGATARVCRDVSIVDRDLPLEVPWDAAAFTPPSTDELATLYRELDFKSLLARLPDVRAPALVTVAPSLDGSYASFVAAVDPPEFVRLAGLLADAAGSERVGMALGADGSLGVATQSDRGFSFGLEALDHRDARAAFERLGVATPIVAHDAKGVLRALAPRGASFADVTDDTMVLAHLLDPARSYANLGDAAERYLGVALAGEGAPYAAAALRLAPQMRALLAERDQLELYERVELPLVPVLARMEERGIAVDIAALGDLAAEVDEAIARLQEEIYALAGERFNIGSPQQLGTVLFERLGLLGGTRNKTGWATGVEVLQGLAREHPICGRVLDFREVTKLKNTYIDVIPRLVGPDGRLRTIFNQTSTATGRISSTNPNLQNIPVRSELGRRVRRAFVAPDDRRVLLAADYSQIELRVMAHLSGDAAMREAFARGDDIHDFTARGLFAVAAGAHPDANQRRIAKSVNFGLLYGMSEFGLAQRLEIERAEARAMTDAYFGRFPSVRAYIERVLETGRERGYVETILGRRRYMPDLQSRNYSLRAAAEREATNAPMQGSAADLMKLAMVRIDARLAAERLDAAMLLQIHDELVFEVAREELETTAELVRHEMEHALELSVPLVVTLKSGRSLYDMTALDA